MHKTLQSRFCPFVFFFHVDDMKEKNKQQIAKTNYKIHIIKYY